MSHVPFDMQVEILKKLPVKSLIRFRSVSKQWKSLIGSYDFNVNYPGQQHLFVTHPGVPNHGCTYVSNRRRECFSIIDDNDNDNDDTFPKEEISLLVPESVKLLTRLKVSGSTHGLFCLFGRKKSPRKSRFIFRYKAVVWNPSIRKSVAINIPGSYKYSPVIGFGVCPKTSDPKIVKISLDRSSEKLEANDWHVEVYTLSSRVWRTPFVSCPSKFIRNIYHDHVVNVDGFIYWLVDDISRPMIMSFNLTSEEFTKVSIPYSLTFESVYDYDYIHMFKLKESLALIEYNRTCNRVIYKVWIMDNGVSKSFTNLYTVILPYEKYLRVVGFRKNGEWIMEQIDDYEDTTKLKVYKPCSRRITDLDIYGLTYPVIVSSYTESLLLLEQTKQNRTNKRKLDTLVDDEADGHIETNQGD